VSSLLSNSDHTVDFGNPIAFSPGGLAPAFVQAWLQVVGTPFDNTQSDSGQGNLGANFIQESDVIFDQANGRLGWAASVCNSGSSGANHSSSGTIYSSSCFLG
jgi:hypothetical protein